MARQLPDPAGAPDPEARRIIDAIGEYLRSDRDPLTITRGLRHILLHSEAAWDASVAQAREWPDRTTRHTWAEITAATGDGMGTLQGRVRAHRARARGERPYTHPRRESP